MIDINLYISKLLFTHNRVVVPNFGVFELLVQEVYNHPVSNEFTPKYKVIKFTKNFEAVDDLLEKSIGSNSDKSIEDFVESIKIILKESNQYEFENIGIVKMHPSGALVFEQNLDFNYEKTYFGLQAFEAKPIVKEEEIKAAPVIVDEENPKRKLVWLWVFLVAAAVIIAAFIIFKDQLFVKSPPLIVKVVDKPINNSATQPEIAVVDTASQNSSVVDTVVEDVLSDSVVIQEVVKVDTTELIEDKTEIEPIPEIINKNKKKYFVIAGCFRSEEKAQEYLQEIILKGYSDASIEGETSGGLIRVCYAGFEKRSKAKIFMKETAEKESKSLWIQKIIH